MVSTPNNGRAPRRGRAVDLGISRSFTPIRIERRRPSRSSQASGLLVHLFLFFASPAPLECARAPSFGRKRLKKPFEKNRTFCVRLRDFSKWKKRRSRFLEIFTPKPRLEGLPPQQGISTLPRRPLKAPGSLLHMAPVLVHGGTRRAKRARREEPPSAQGWQ